MLLFLLSEILSDSVLRADADCWRTLLLKISRVESICDYKSFLFFAYSNFSILSTFCCFFIYITKLLILGPSCSIILLLLNLSCLVDAIFSPSSKISATLGDDLAELVVA